MILELFLGMPVDQSLLLQLNHVNPFTKSTFIQEGYLQELEIQGKSYIGKKLGKTMEFQHVEALESNICSLIKKIVPDYSPAPLILISYYATT